MLILRKLSTPPILPGGSQKATRHVRQRDTIAFLQLGSGDDPSLEMHACHRPAWISPRSEDARGKLVKALLLDARPREAIRRCRRDGIQSHHMANRHVLRCPPSLMPNSRRPSPSLHGIIIGRGSGSGSRTGSGTTRFGNSEMVTTVGIER